MYVLVGFMVLPILGIVIILCTHSTQNTASFQSDEKTKSESRSSSEHCYEVIVEVPQVSTNNVNPVRYSPEESNHTVSSDDEEGEYISLETDIYADPNEEDEKEHILPCEQLFEVDRTRIHLHEVILTNRFHRIHSGEGFSIGGKEDTTKICIKEPTDPEASGTMVKKEINILKRLAHHDNIDNLFACCTTADPIYLITEKYPYGDIKTFITERQLSLETSDVITFHKQLLSFAIDIAMAMEYITSKKIIHRYLAAKHILLDDQLRCKVSNFSYSEGVIMDSEFFRVTNECEQCFRWISLETFEERIFTTKTDIWSFGVVLWEIFTYGLSPYVGHCKEDVVEKLKRGYRLLKPDYVDGDVYNLMVQCWEKRPDDRPTFTSLLSRLEALRENEEVPAEHYKELDGFFESEYITPGQNVFEVNRNLVMIKDVLYKGEFGDIFAGETSLAGKEKSLKKIAIKIQKGDDEMVAAQAASKEVEVMKTISNINVISLLAYSTNKEKPYLILEYSQHGNLKAYLQRNRAKFLTDNNAASQEQLLSFAVDIAKGMKHIASHRIIHRYLAAKHVLVCNELTCKISNLSYTSDVSDGSRFTKLAKRGELPYPWMAPESQTNWTFSVKSDVWSFGVVLWEIATLGCDPFENSTQAEVLSLLQSGLRLQRYSHIDENLYDLMLACWQKIPKERLSFSSILQRTKQLRDSKDELLKFELYN